MFVGVSVSAVEQVLLSPSHRQVCTALLLCCSVTDLGGGREETLSNGEGG